MEVVWRGGSARGVAFPGMVACADVMPEQGYDWTVT